MVAKEMRRGNDAILFDVDMKISVVLDIDKGLVLPCAGHDQIPEFDSLFPSQCASPAMLRRSKCYEQFAFVVDQLFNKRLDLIRLETVETDLDDVCDAVRQIEPRADLLDCLTADRNAYL